MNYQISTNGKPAYLQLYESLRNDMEHGVFPYGTKLPSKRMLAEETGVSVITVQHAYAILCEEGYIESRQRSGYFVSYRDSEFVPVAEGNQVQRLLEKTTPHTHKKSEFPFSVLAKTMRKVLLDYNKEILIKSPNKGCAELRAAISAYVKRSNGITVKPEQIVIGSGAEYLYSLIVQLLGENRVFALEDPSYEKIRKVYEANGVLCEMLCLGQDGILSSALEKSKASVLHVTPFHSYPSGVSAGVSKRLEYLNWARTRNGYIIEDNYDSELTVSMKHEDTLFSMEENAPVLYLNTFSHTIAPSMRVGYMMLPEGLLDLFEERLGFYSCTVPVFEQYVLAELINSGDFERHINRVRRERRKEK
ncbi:MAG: PLP-dependent aminotransferase family protein [Lachnospiraceae bacterium]|nr:PLP-dependent aminotransferase family protein [Lachnospiraceae bacterium]